MCPFVVLTLLFSFLVFLLEITAAIVVTFHPSKFQNITEDNESTVYFWLNISNSTPQNESIYKVVSSNQDIAEVSNVTYTLNNDTRTLNGSFVVRGSFLGITTVHVVKEKNGKTVAMSNPLAVRIERKVRAISRAFTMSVIVLVSLNYINMGCALDLNVVKSVLQKPIAPIVGFCCQYAIMPLVAYGLARFLFDDIVLQLGLFTFGCSPGGGASNTWTVLLKGNLNLSLTMTFISGLAALGMIPLWLFTLGRTLFSQIALKVPFAMILGTLAMMLITLGIGLLFQRVLPKVAKFCRRILAPASIIMIIFIIIFGTYANLYMFKLFTWQIILAATVNVWLGFLFGGISSKIFRLTLEDVIAISVETGVQNTGVAIILLGLSLPSPECDLATVVPVAASIMTPIPLLAVFCVQKIHNRFFDRNRAKQAYVTDAEDEERKALPTPNSFDSIEGVKITNGYVF